MHKQFLYLFLILCSYTLIFSSERNKYTPHSPQILVDNRVEKAECTACACGSAGTCILCTSSDPCCVGKACCVLSFLFTGYAIHHQKQTTGYKINHSTPQLQLMVDERKK